ncbi:MAG: Gfo/Idh/MocA family oxidoreductase [Myxococcota bacterium]|nr:Gfo/Idh/MocA family oxidoreductase [Myxococcota bacterium]
MKPSSPLPLVLVGAGYRAGTMYAPLLCDALSDRVRLVGVVSRSEGRARALAEELSVPWALDLDALKGWGAEGAVVAVSPDQNHEVARGLVDLGVPALLETPLSLKLTDAHDLLTVIEGSGLPFEIAEQNPRHLAARLWARIVEDGLLGELRCVSSDGAGYRYHATALARRLLGQRTALSAVGMRSITGIDLDRGIPREPVCVGSIQVGGGAIFQLRSSEAFFVETAGWQQGDWVLLGDKGSLTSSGGVHCQGEEGRRHLPVEWEHRRVGTQSIPTGVSLAGHEGLAVATALPGFDASDDQQAVGRCVLDWLERMAGRPSKTSWSARDAYEDLAWIIAIERSAALGGVRLQVGLPQQGSTEP